jgi:hypothetical protein
MAPTIFLIAVTAAVGTGVALRRILDAIDPATFPELHRAD